MYVEKIYLDMDNVLADFTRGVNELCGIDAAEQTNNNEEHDNKMWNEIKKVKNFYDRLELMPQAKEMFDIIYNKYGNRCEILTKVPSERRGIPEAETDKIKWVRRLLSKDIKINIVRSEGKKPYCLNRNCVLIDDYQENIDKWNENGTGVLYTNYTETMNKLKELEII